MSDLNRAIEIAVDYPLTELSSTVDDQSPTRAYLESTDPDNEGCARVDCPGAGGSGLGCEECAEWWDGEKMQVRY